MHPVLKFATPLTIGAFILMAVTGVLMFFHLDTGLNKEAHEWLSWVFLTGVGLHVTRNLPAFKRHLASKAGGVLVGTFLVILAATFVISPDEGGKPPVRQIVQALSAAPVESIAAVTGETPESLIARLSAKGYDVEQPGQTLSEISGGPDKTMELIGVVFEQK